MKKHKKKKKTRNFGIINYLGEKIITKVVTIKDMPGWEGWKGVTGISDSYVLGPKGVIVGWLKTRAKQKGVGRIQIFTFKKDMSIHIAKGWDIKQAMRFAYLKTQQQK